MTRRKWSLTLLSVTLLFALTVGGYVGFARRQAESAAAQFTYYSYAVKFVCGMQPMVDVPGEPPVKPGNYATEINIHNYQYLTAQVPIFKKVVLLVHGREALGREPKSVEPTAFDRITLKPDAATMDDCNRISELLQEPPAIPMPLMIGYLVLISTHDLDVDAVYTAEVPGKPNATPTGISIDVEHIAGKQLILPVGAASMEEFLTNPR